MKKAKRCPSGDQAPPRLKPSVVRRRREPRSRSNSHRSAPCMLLATTRRPSGDSRGLRIWSSSGQAAIALAWTIEPDECARGFAGQVDERPVAGRGEAAFAGVALGQPDRVDQRYRRPGDRQARGVEGHPPNLALADEQQLAAGRQLRRRAFDQAVARPASRARRPRCTRGWAAGGSAPAPPSSPAGRRLRGTARSLRSPR